MKTGIFFYFNMGHITKIARIAFVALAAILIFRTRFLSAFYPVYSKMFIISIFLSIIPAPSDKRFVNFLERFYQHVMQKTMDTCDLKRDNLVLMIKAFVNGGKYQLGRCYKNHMIYTTAVGAAFVEKSGKRFLVIGKKSLIWSSPEQYTVIDLNLEAPRITARVQEDEDAGDHAVIHVESASLPDGIDLICFVDYRYRDFMAAMKEFCVES